MNFKKYFHPNESFFKFKQSLNPCIQQTKIYNNRTELKFHNNHINHLISFDIYVHPLV